MSRLAGAVFLGSVVAGSACAIDIGRQEVVSREEKRFNTDGVADVHLYTFDGAIQVRAWDRPEVVVEIEKRGHDKESLENIEIVTDRQGSRIQIEARAPARSGGIRFSSPSAGFIVKVPRTCNLVLRTGDGAIRVERVTGRLELRTKDGGIWALETQGDLVADTEDGSIDLEDVGGRVEVRTDDGSLRITGSPSALRARSGDGTVSVRIRPGTVMSEDWIVATDDGSVSLELPDGFGADVEADPGDDGRARSDIPLLDVVGGTRDNRVLRGRMGSGGRKLVVRTGDGNIKIH